jgi:hypothetical protein
MNRDVCEHAVPFEQTCDECDLIWDSSMLELLEGYRGLVDGVESLVEIYKPKSPAQEAWKKRWLELLVLLEKRYNKLK